MLHGPQNLYPLQLCSLKSCGSCTICLSLFVFFFTLPEPYLASLFPFLSAPSLFLSVPIWSCLVLSGREWSCLVLSVNVKSFLVLSGLFWSCLFLCGLCTWTIKKLRSLGARNPGETSDVIKKSDNLSRCSLSGWLLI